jgi:hypothetical protein
MWMELIIVCSTVSPQYSSPETVDNRVKAQLELLLSDASFEAFTVVTLAVEVFWVVTPCSVVVRFEIRTLDLPNNKL